MILALLASVTIAQSSTPVEAYHIYITRRFESFGVAGELKITETDDGYVNGTFRTETGGRLYSVHGGYKGKSIWLDFDGYHLQGKKKDGEISGVGSSLGPGNRTYAFTATPQTPPSP